MKIKWINIVMIIFFIIVIIAKILYKPEVSNFGLAIPIFFILTNFIGLFRKEEEPGIK